MNDNFRNFTVTSTGEPAKQGLLLLVFTITYEQNVAGDWKPVTVQGFGGLPEEALNALAADYPDKLPAGIRALDGNYATAIRILIEARERGYFFFK